MVDGRKGIEVDRQPGNSPEITQKDSFEAHFVLGGHPLHRKLDPAKLPEDHFRLARDWTEVPAAHQHSANTEAQLH
ncbi:regulatory ligand binding protein-like protein [Anopheles sinensis]|uniref:Regulatory ligand binding protein-like protein n=1 Tax=Anopheles sinensis TaxID=74873 RepID=A0A084WBU0_ANOSI|nr:regulatory ligand binding protein-like protein [Anopheles sinensis]